VASLLKRARVGAASFPTLFEAGNALLRAGRPKDALRLYADMEKATRTGEAAAADPRVHFNSGYALAQIGRHFAAARAYRRALELVPQDADAWFNLANAYREAGALGKAARAYRQALDLNLSDHEAWNNFGNCRAALGDAPGAITAYRASLALRPDYHAAWNNLGNVLQFLRRHREAIACYDRAIMLDGEGDLLCFFNRSLSLLAAGRIDEALLDIRRWSVVGPVRESASGATTGPDWVRLLRSIAPPRARQGAR